MRRLFGLLMLSALVLTGCEIKDQERDQTEETGEKELTEMLVLCEGTWNQNNSTLARYTFADEKLETDYFRAVNGRGLGDTSNDMKRYGGKVYIVVNVSSQVEVIDAATGRSLKQIAMMEGETARQPRNVVFDGGKAYVCCFDGTVCRIDTASLEIDGTVECGLNPEDLCVARGKLYVSNSGGMNYENGYDSTVSVVSIQDFKEVKKIAVGTNPGVIQADAQGNVWVLTKGDYAEERASMHKIDTESDEVAQSFPELAASNFTIAGDTAYVYSYDYMTQEYWIKLFDCKSGSVVKEQFVADNTEIIQPYSLTVNRQNGDVYVTDARDNMTAGDVICFDKEGKFRYRVKEVGIAPNNIVLM